MTRHAVLPLALALSFAVPGAAGAAPRNDNFGAARTITAGSVTLGVLKGSTRQRGEPRHADVRSRGSVWYRYRPERTGAIALNTCSARFDTVVAVYTGRTLRGLSEVASNDDFCNNLGSRVVLQAVAGETYRIAVAAFHATRVGTGRFELVATPVEPPANDAFDGAAPIRLGRRYVRSTEAATPQAGEPAHAGEAATHSVWFRFRAPRTERVTAITTGSSFDTVLAVYRGDAVGSLRRVAENDDGPRQSLASRVTFAVTAGATYAIALDGFEGASGDAVLLVRRGG